MLPARPGSVAHGLGQTLGVTVTLATVLEQRAAASPDELRRFLAPRLAHLTPPQSMADRDVVAARLGAAVRSQQRICVFGDYDCDGITATAILVQVLGALGGQAVAVLGSRFDGGYGITEAAARRIQAARAELLVTCDCGSSDHEALARLNDQGLESIVIDHHLVPSAPLPAIAFLNPNRPDCAFPYKHLASCGLVLSVAAALRAELDHELDLRNWLDLVAIGTIADVVPLDGDNRVLVRAGLERLSRAPRPGIAALMELARLTPGAMITAEDVAFRLAPRLNAPGRLGAPDLALELLLERSPEQARVLAAQLEQLTTERKVQQERIVAEAIAEVEQRGWATRPALVLGQRGWNHGVVGIAASRLVERYGRPVVVIGIDDQGVGRGSVRGPAGSRLHDALEVARDVLERFGGHQAAAGLEVHERRLDELRERFEQACADQDATAVDEGGECGTLVWLSEADELGRVLDDLERLEPCGKGNPPPRIVVDARVVAAREVRGGHLKLELEAAGGRRLAAFGVGLGAWAAQARGPITVVGKLRRDGWRGGDAAEIRIERMLR